MRRELGLCEGRNHIYIYLTFKEMFTTGSFDNSNL